ncbi:hypothetical protein SAMN02745148_02116 [Modicisalibacter ilicicola DSM 19980]|uniref:Uncharacterized protein n=1 Tax=Modicisalibacter ilicicola DSM 19980 TaxID=1121942 RepID=A0A1M4ZZ84_9GAMM|nr:DUF6494 family protein [Halomonas ilicicola]SHF23274.1 hypothetical protein SAMN02745148_02116 [Halomonas ilicicola DSM 19980]
MNEETFNLSIRKFLKKVGIGSQREIEQAVDKAIEEGRLKGTETLPARMTLEVGDLNLRIDFEGNVELE